MTARVLHQRRQVNAARAELRRRSLSCLSSRIPWRYLVRKLGVSIPGTIGYRIKSWDVLETVSFLEARLPQTARVLDIGANTSEILCILHRLGYTDLTGVDLAPEVARMPYAGAIRYLCKDFMATGFEEESFDAITAISSIEHGYNGPALFRECARLLRPGGLLIVSFDYWPDKIDTSGTLMYGMTWRIFSRDETLEMIETAGGYGLTPVGALELEAGDRVVKWGPWAYTFAWVALQRSAAADRDLT